MTTIMGRILQDISARGSLDWLDHLDATPDEFAQEDQPIENDEIPLQDAVQACHEVARKIEAIG
jgi:hypothetical protein